MADLRVTARLRSLTTGVEMASWRRELAGRSPAKVAVLPVAPMMRKEPQQRNSRLRKIGD
jgi:hypothetical protein